MMKKILFTGGGGAGSEFVAKKWNDKYSMYFADANVESISPSIPDTRKISIPMANSSNFIEEILAVCTERKIDILVPGVDEELSLISENNNKSGWPEIMVPQKFFVDIMLDKYQCFEELRNNDFVIPKTYLLKDAYKLDFPIIVKPRSGRGSRGVVTLNNLSQIDAYLSLYGGDYDDYIAQELIQGQEYTVFVSANKEGKLCAVIPIKVELKKGITILAEIDFVPEIYEYISRFQSFFQAQSIYNFQCILTNDRVVMPFEVNPRISTTFCLAISTGFDPIESFDLCDIDIPTFFPEKKISLRRDWINFIN